MKSQFPLTPTSVKLAAMLLLESNDSITTLDVKSLLRHLGYYATQEDVSVYMNNAASELPLDFTTNGSYRVYTLPTPSTVTDNATNATKTDNTNPTSSTISYTRRDGRVIIGSFAELTAADGSWVVSSATTKPAYFDGSLSRDDVRQAYAKSVDVDFHVTRASRYA